MVQIVEQVWIGTSQLLIVIILISFHDVDKFFSHYCIICAEPMKKKVRVSEMLLDAVEIRDLDDVICS